MTREDQSANFFRKHTLELAPLKLRVSPLHQPKVLRAKEVDFSSISQPRLLLNGRFAINPRRGKEVGLSDERPPGKDVMVLIHEAPPGSLCWAALPCAPHVCRFGGRSWLHLQVCVECMDIRWTTRLLLMSLCEEKIAGERSAVILQRLCHSEQFEAALVSGSRPYSRPS